MKNKHYKADILERFMSKDAQRLFDEKYDAHKVRSIGQKVVKRSLCEKLFERNVK